ncbi:MAG: hypothetical protein N4A38_02990 [Candidatus Gracilibacteria bacterium]|nr:hypothetical protein [Candidatus Gracilibacteria bacterium]
MANNDFGPKEINIKTIGVNTLGAFISGFIGSILIVMLVFFLGNAFDITGNLSGTNIITKTNGFFPLVISIITLIGTSISSFLSYIFLSATNPEKYRKSSIHFKQISFFLMLVYVFITPIYIILGLKNYTNLILVFIGHIFIISVGINLILEILNNYRYILTGIYGSFFALFINIILVVVTFGSLSSGMAKMLSLIILLPLINAFIIFFKEIFELIYYKYYLSTSLDPIGDIFYQVEMEEKEALKEAIESNI